MIKPLLIASAVVEVATGLALLTIPALLAPLLIGAALDTAAGLAVARVAGAGLLSLGVACWFGSRDSQSAAAAGMVRAMLVYNVVVAALLLGLRFVSGLGGMGLLPAAAGHAVLAWWCIAALRAARR
jgi:hypothetical protein